MYGQLGVLSYDEVEDKVQCHICGEWFRGLNAHIRQTHHWTLDEYREEFGLNRGQSLICEGTRKRLSDLNKQLGNWKHLVSQTMTKDELSAFFRSVALKPGYRLRQQTNLGKSERLKQYNPMNEPEVNQRRIATEKRTWYGSQRMRDVCRQNILNTIAKVREKNLRERRWTCPCGEVFPCRKAGEHHRKDCPIARSAKRGKVIKSREKYLASLTPENRLAINQHISEGKKRQYAESKMHDLRPLPSGRCG